MSSKHFVGRAEGCGRPREWATTARQKGLPSEAKRARDDEGAEEGEEEEAKEAADEEEEEEAKEGRLLPIPSFCCRGQGAL